MSFLPLLVAVVAFLFLPDTIPIHWNSEGEITRWGSKYGLGQFLIPVLCISLGLTFAAAGLSFSKNNHDDSWNIWDEISVGMSAFLLLIGLYISYLMISNVDLAVPAIGGSRTMSLFIGIIMIFLSSIMVFAKPNFYLGVRTKWSMANEDVWRKSQRFGAVTFSAGGAIIIVADIMFLGGKFESMLFALAVVVAVGIACALQSRWVSKKVQS